MNGQNHTWARGLPVCPSFLKFPNFELPPLPGHDFFCGSMQCNIESIFKCEDPFLDTPFYGSNSVHVWSNLYFLSNSLWFSTEHILAQFFVGEKLVLSTLFEIVFFTIDLISDSRWAISTICKLQFPKHTI